MSYAGDEDGAGRPKLSLQPRGSAADGVSATSAKSSRPNPFGAARPREQVIAEREGKKETEVLKEQIQKDWKPAIVFTEAQREEKKAAEAELAFAKSELEKEVDPLKLKGLRDEVALKEKRLDELLLSFEKLAVQSAQSGGTRRSHERTRREDDRVSSSPVPQYGREVADSTEGYGNFRGRGRERDRDPEGTGSYGDTWGGSTRKSGSSQPCYTCGEVGHFSRECPSGGGGSRGAYGGNFGGGGRSSGGRQCYTCGQEGHFSRECPQGGGGSYGGARGGSYGSGGGAGGYGGGYDAYGGGGGGGGGSYVQDYQAPSSYGGQAAGGYGTGYDDRSAGGGYGAAANRGGSYSTGRPEYDSRGSW